MRPSSTLFALVAGGAVTAGLMAPPLRAQAPVTPPAGVMADTLALTLADVFHLARTRGLDLEASRQMIGMAAGDLRESRVTGFNPTVGYQRFESGRPGESAEYGLTVSENLGWVTQRGPRVAAARSALERTVAEVGDQERLATREAGRVFVAALAAERRLALADQMVAATRRLSDVTQIQLREGEISVLEANLAEIEFGRTQARALTARREATTTLLELRRWIGVEPTTAILLVEPADVALGPGRLIEDSLMAMAVRRRPDLVAQRRAVEEAAVRRQLAVREGIPMPTLMGMLARDPGGANARLGIGVSMPIALVDRNQGRVQREAFGYEQAAIRLEAVLLTVRLEVREARLAYLAASEEVASLESRVLTPVRDNLALLDSAYRAGKVGLPTLLLLRNQLFEAEVDYWRAWQAKREALLRLQAAIGVPTGSATVTSLEDTP
ncbi:MAG: TolC family protein [Gemmatimonadales bacterium]